jgi:hypothetical protein
MIEIQCEREFSTGDLYCGKPVIKKESFVLYVSEIMVPCNVCKDKVRYQERLMGMCETCAAKEFRQMSRENLRQALWMCGFGAVIVVIYFIWGAYVG